MATAAQIAQARGLFDTYVTGTTPNQATLDFWANEIATKGLQGATQAFLNPSDPNAPRLAAMRQDPDYINATRPAARGNYSVTDMYYQYLNRAPDAAGLSFWTEAIKGGPTTGIDPEEITAFLRAANQGGEMPNYLAPVTSRPIAVDSGEGTSQIFQGPQYTPAAREGDKEFEGQKYFEADKQNILKQLQAQQAAGMKYTASFTSDEAKILDDLATRLAAQGVKNLTDIKPIMSGEVTQQKSEGSGFDTSESFQIGLYNSATGEPLNMKMLTNNQGKGTTNYKATFVNGIPVFTASKAATGLEQIQQDFGPILAIAASAILPGLPVGNMTLGQFLGTNLGLSGAAAQAVGNALVAGGGTFAATGSAEKAALAALMVGGGGFIKDTGVLGDVMDRVGLGDYRQTFGVLNSAQAGDLNFVAADATQLASQGLGVNGIQQNLIMAGVDPTIAASAANLAVTGATTGQIVTDLKNFTGGNNVFTGVDTGAATGITATTGAGQTGLTGTTTTTTGGGGTGLVTGTTTTGTGGALGSGLTTGTGGATLGGGTTTTTGTTLGSGLTTGGTGAVIGGGTGLVTGTTLGTGLTGAVSNVAGGLLGSLLNQVPNVVGTGINYAVQQRQIEQLLGVGNQAAARLNELASKSMLSPAEYQELTRLANQVKADTAAAGQASQVPFTPYTMTTGFGTTGVTPTGATATTAPEYEALRQQSLGLAGQTLGAINPAQAAQTLYGQVEALAAPGREREQLALQQRLARQGLLGFGTTLPTTGGGARTVNPLFESLLSAQETARAQQALQAQQFGTAEATRQAALAQGLLGQAQGIDQQTLAQLQATGQLGINLNQLEQANRARALQAQLAGISAPLTTGLSAAQLRQADLQRQAQLGAQASQVQTQAAIAALGPQQQQTQAVGNLASGLLTPFINAAVQEIFK